MADEFTGNYAPPGVYTTVACKDPNCKSCNPPAAPASQADGYVADAEEATELVEEMVSTTVLYDTFGRYIAYLGEAFQDLEGISEECNPVVTHLTIQDYKNAIIAGAHTLRDELIEKLAQRGEQITEKGGTLRTQVLNDEDEDS